MNHTDSHAVTRAFIKLIDAHPAIVEDLQRVLQTLDADQRITFQEMEDIRAYAADRWLSNRVNATEAARAEQQREQRPVSVPGGHERSSRQIAGSRAGSPLPRSGSDTAHLRSEAARRNRQTKRFTEGYREAVELLEPHDSRAARDIRRYVGALRDEAAAFRIYARNVDRAAH